MKTKSKIFQNCLPSEELKKKFWRPGLATHQSRVLNTHISMVISDTAFIFCGDCSDIDDVCNVAHDMFHVDNTK